MTAALVVLALATLGFGRTAAAVARRTHPGPALWALTAGGLALGAATLVSLAAVGVTAVSAVPPVAARLGWRAAVLGAHVPLGVAVGALALLAVLAVRVLLAARTSGLRLREAWSTTRDCPGLVVVAGSSAYAVPGRRGSVVVGRDLLAALDADGRRALLAHEQAHLDERHALHLVAASLAVAANPLLRGLPAAVRTACERRADEAACRSTGDRAVVADTIARVARPAAGRDLVLAGAGADVPLRVTALLRPRASRRAALVPVAPVVAAYAALLLLGHRLDAVLDAAHLIGTR